MQDVHADPNHIACDAETKSEIVVPILDSEGVCRGVLDVDSKVVGAWEEEDRIGLEALAKLVGEGCEW